MARRLLSCPCAGRLRSPVHFILARSLAASNLPNRHYTAATIASRSSTPHVMNPTRKVSHTRSDRPQRAVETTVSRKRDPWKVANEVEWKLGQNRYEDALHLAKMASKDGDMVVAWNHLIMYTMKQEKLKDAIRLYNDMKKRAQLPNVSTFTIIFQGCANSQHPKLAVAEAVKHYNVLLNDRRLQPNSIHLNAVLNVCAKAGDMDSLFLIAGTSNESTRAPTSTTYTIIFHALRNQCITGTRDEDLPQEHKAAHLQKTVDRAKSLWADAVQRWSQGRLVMDEQLVCAFARVLLLAPRREDRIEVFNILQQTMNLTNLTMAADPDSSEDTSNAAPTDGSVSPAKVEAGAVPGRNTLDVVLTALTSASLTTAGIKYWNLLVDQHGIDPDRANWFRFFFMLKIAKASTTAADKLELVPKGLIDHKLFYLAMETCVRDNINHNAVETSKRILQSMLNHYQVPDLHTLRLYLRVALVSHYEFRVMASKGQEARAKRAYGLQIHEALRQLKGPFEKVYEYYFNPATVTQGDQDATTGPYNEKREVIALARRMLSAANKLINEDLLEKAEAKELRGHAANINRRIQTFYSDRETMEPQLRLPDEEPRTISPSKPGGDFVWDTTKPSSVVSSRQRRRRREDRIQGSPVDVAAETEP